VLGEERLGERGEVLDGPVLASAHHEVNSKEFDVFFAFASAPPLLSRCRLRVVLE
jgi:hypothetical protein